MCAFLHFPPISSMQVKHLYYTVLYLAKRVKLIVEESKNRDAEMWEFICSTSSTSMQKKNPHSKWIIKENFPFLLFQKRISQTWMEEEETSCDGMMLLISKITDSAGLLPPFPPSLPPPSLPSLRHDFVLGEERKRSIDILQHVNSHFSDLLA